jgi:hypothetical protein
MIKLLMIFSGTSIYEEARDQEKYQTNFLISSQKRYIKIFMIWQISLPPSRPSSRT